MFINEKKNAIELSKKEAAAAAKFGTREYKALQEARKDYPGFKVVTITRKSTVKKESYKGLTYAYMETYIQKHDDENKTIMAEYKMLVVFKTVQYVFVEADSDEEAEELTNQLIADGLENCETAEIINDTVDVWIDEVYE